MSRDGYAAEIIREGRQNRSEGALTHPAMTVRGIQIALATALVESDLVMYANEADPESLKHPHTALSRDANSVGLFQQREPWWGTCADRMNPARSAALFYSQLAKLNYSDESQSPGWYAQQVQKSAYPTRYDEKFGQAVALYERLQSMPVSGERPDYNEFPLWSPNFSVRNGKPTMLLLHTQEGNGNALSLAEYLGNPANQVSYHYTVSQDLRDNGVTVVDCVDTDFASWSVLDYNSRSINLCFAGSTVKWSQAEWMKRSKALDAAAFIAVQDSKKYGFATNVVPPPYRGVPGISDHAYVTSRGVGNHSDVGPNFPWAFFEQCVNKHLGAPAAPPAVVAEKKTVGSADEQLTLRWNSLGGQTIVEALAEIRDKVTGTNDRGKQGVK